MARKLLRPFWKSKQHVTLDELGGSPDGALVILGTDGAHLHVTPPRVASSLRFLLARLQLPGEDGLPPRLAVTSALRGEGVSYMTRSLAAVIAYDTDNSVGVVDLNWRNPPSAKSKGQTPPETSTVPTLADAVEQGLDVTEIIRPTTNPRLSLVAAGVVLAARRPAMAGSRALEDTIDKLGQHFDHLLLDLPPVLASSDTITLSQLAERFLLVVQQGVTSNTQVEASLEELGGGRSIGVVFNRVDSKVPRRLAKMLGG